MSTVKTFLTKPFKCNFLIGHAELHTINEDGEEVIYELETEEDAIEMTSPYTTISRKEVSRKISSSRISVWYDYPIVINGDEIEDLPQQDLLRLMETCEDVSISKPMLLDGLRSETIKILNVDCYDMKLKTLAGIDLPCLGELHVFCRKESSYESVTHWSEFTGPYTTLTGDEGWSHVTPKVPIEIDLRSFINVSRLSLINVRDALQHEDIITFPNLECLSTTASSIFLRIFDMPVLNMLYIEGCYGEKNVEYTVLPRHAPVLKELTVNLNSPHKSYVMIYGKTAESLKKVSIGLKTFCKFRHGSYPNLLELSVEEDTLRELVALELTTLQIRSSRVSLKTITTPKLVNLKVRVGDVPDFIPNVENLEEISVYHDNYTTRVPYVPNLVLTGNNGKFIRIRSEKRSSAKSAHKAKYK